ncbi:hypothetical protein SprV_0501944800 [Sparganum proliferum]
MLTFRQQVVNLQGLHQFTLYGPFHNFAGTVAIKPPRPLVRSYTRHWAVVVDELQKDILEQLPVMGGITPKRTGPLLSEDLITLLTKITQILKRRDDHFLNRPFTVSDAAKTRLPQMETDTDLDIPPFLLETIKAAKQLSSWKAPGSEAMFAEIYKHGGPEL